MSKYQNLPLDRNSDFQPALVNNVHWDDTWHLKPAVLKKSSFSNKGYSMA